MRINTIPTLTVLAIITAIAAVVLLFIFVMPEKKREKMPKIVKQICDIFDFKKLYLELVLRFVYVLGTIWCIVQGLFMLIGFNIYSSDYYSYFHWYGGYGLLLMILGPIVLRLVFEGFMMFILLVKNTIQINNKLKGEKDSEIEE